MNEPIDLYPNIYRMSARNQGKTKQSIELALLKKLKEHASLYYNDTSPVNDSEDFAEVLRAVPLSVIDSMIKELEKT